MLSKETFHLKTDFKGLNQTEVLVLRKKNNRDKLGHPVIKWSFDVNAISMAFFSTTKCLVKWLCSAFSIISVTLMCSKLFFSPAFDKMLHCSLVYVIVPHKIVGFYQHTYSKVDAVICGKRGASGEKNLFWIYNNGMSFLTMQDFLTTLLNIFPITFCV